MRHLAIWPRSRESPNLDRRRAARATPLLLFWRMAPSFGCRLFTIMLSLLDDASCGPVLLRCCALGDRCPMPHAEECFVYVLDASYYAYF